MINNTEELLTFIDNSPTSYQAIENVVEKLNKNNFTRLLKNQKWDLKENGDYYIVNEDSSLIAFSLGADINEGFNLVASHTDSPLIKIKPNAEVITEGHYLSLNVEVYGGPILHTWFDRGLSIAGRVIVKENNKIFAKIIDLKRTVLTIPSLAIHLDRDADATKINKQNHLKPIVTFLVDKLEKDECIYRLIREQIGNGVEEILDFALYLYDNQKGEVFGLNNELYQSKNLDDLLMVHTSTVAFLNADSKKSKVLFLTDNEEVGSNTATGAESMFFESTLERIFLALKKTKEDYFIALANSYCLSCDLAHAYHPNYREKYDETNRPLLGKGIVIKHSANKSYSTESYYASVFKKELSKRNIEYQEYVNRSDIRGGGTIGPMLSKKFGFSAIDLGPCILGMHSVRETGAVSDITNAIEALQCFYEMEN